MAIKTYTDDNQNLKLVDNVQTTPRTLDELSKGSNSAHASRHAKGGADEISIENFDEIAKGWLPANETWTCNGTNVAGPGQAPQYNIVISGDKTGKYQKGDKTKFTQGTVKQAYILSVTYSDPNTTLKIVVDKNTTISDDDISANYYSKIENPQGFPILFNWNPNYSAGGSMTFTSVTTTMAKFKISNNLCKFFLHANGTTGGTAYHVIKATLPITGVESYYTGCHLFDSGIQIAGIMYSYIVDVSFIKYNQSNWGLGAERYIRGQMEYFI